MDGWRTCIFIFDFSRVTKLFADVAVVRPLSLNYKSPKNKLFPGSTKLPSQTCTGKADPYCL